MQSRPLLKPSFHSDIPCADFVNIEHRDTAFLATLKMVVLLTFAHDYTLLCFLLQRIRFGNIHYFYKLFCGNKAFLLPD